MHLWISALSAFSMDLLLYSSIFIAPYNRNHPHPAESQVCFF